jgi:hypothetical protein
VLDVENFPNHAANGERAVLLVRFFGDVLERADELLSALERLGQRGLGNRHRVRMKLKEVWDIHRERQVFHAETTAEPPAGNELYLQHARNLGSLARTNPSLDAPFELWLRTPTRIKSPGGELEPPDPKRLLRAVVARVHTMADLYGHTPLLRDDCEALLKQWAEDMDISGPYDTQYPDGLERISQRQNRRHSLDGYLAQWRFESVPMDVFTWLHAAERLHIGGSSAFGYGGIRLVQNMGRR